MFKPERDRTVGCRLEHFLPLKNSRCDKKKTSQTLTLNFAESGESCASRPDVEQRSPSGGAVAHPANDISLTCCDASHRLVSCWDFACVDERGARTCSGLC